MKVSYVEMDAMYGGYKKVIPIREHQPVIIPFACALFNGLGGYHAYQKINSIRSLIAGGSVAILYTMIGLKILQNEPNSDAYDAGFLFSAYHCFLMRPDHFKGHRCKMQWWSLLTCGIMACYTSMGAYYWRGWADYRHQFYAMPKLG